MTSKRKWRQLKMCLSNIKRFVALSILLNLSSCASSLIGENEDTSGAVSTSSDKTASTSLNKSELKNSSNADVDLTISVATTFSGVDPMADIKINAEIKSTYGKVAKLNKTKKYADAIRMLESVQLKYPQLSGPEYQKARIYFNQGKIDMALKSVDESLSNNGRNYYSLNLKGVILRELGRFEEAREIYFMAIETYPPYPNSHLNLGVLADIYLRDLPLALMQYREYMKLTLNQDKKVANWIIEIERRIKAGG